LYAEILFSESEDKLFSIEIKTKVQAFRNYIPEYRSIKKCVSAGTK
jgi:hypothetical protein